VPRGAAVRDLLTPFLWQVHLMAAMNKLIRICYGVIRTRKAFDPTINTTQNAT
jgi:hypothetical protein